jgi:HEPN domain-containing protein
VNKEIAIKWLKQAQHDLKIAEKNIDIEGYDTAAFLAHQAVEKLFKAIFAIQGKPIPKTHYIDELAQQLGLSDDVINDVADLTADYTFARYPDVAEHLPYEEYDEDIARSKVEKAKRIFEVLKKRYEKIEEEP